MKIRKLLILIIFQLSVLNIFATYDIGILDQARLFINRNGGLFAIDLSSMSSLLDYRNNKLIVAKYLYTLEDFNKYKHLATPVTVHSYFHSFVLDQEKAKTPMEFSLSLTLKTPSIYIAEDIFGPAFLMDFGLKKSIVYIKGFALSYKFAWGFGYNSYPGVDFIVKNSLMVGTNFSLVNFNAIFSVLDSFGIGIIPHSRYYDAVLKSSPTLNIVPALELNWSINIANLELIFGLSTIYEVNFELFYAQYIQSNLIFGINIGALFSIPLEVKEKKKQKDEDN